MYMLVQDHKLYFLADCSVNANPTAEELKAITLLSASEVENFGLEPRIAMLSFSNFGSVKNPESEKIDHAVRLIKEERPELMVDGPVQAAVALNPEYLAAQFPFSGLKGRPNLLVFPNLDAGNISLQLLRKLGKAHTIGPIMLGMAKAVQIIPRGSEVNRIINLTAIAGSGCSEVFENEYWKRN